LIDFLVLSATFSNISAISWRPVLMVEDAGVPEENHGQVTGKFYDFRLRVEYTLFVIYKARVIVESQVCTELDVYYVH
jgi:hypothetical protein